MMMNDDYIVLFDGECHFCNRSVQFIINRDDHTIFKFASQQSDVGQRLMKKHRIPNDANSLIFVTPDRAYIKSTAALQIARRLNGLCKLFFAGIIIPRPLRDFVYDLIAKNRYRLSRQMGNCPISSPEMRKRFL